MGLLSRRESISHGVGLGLQVLAVAVAVFWGRGGGGETLAVVISALGVVGALICATVVLPRPRPLTAVGLMAALIAGAGWGSWLMAFLLYGPADPVINITGLLVVPGLFVGVLVQALGLARRRPQRPHGFLFAGPLSVVVLLLAGVDQFFPDAFLAIILAGILLSAGMLLVASTSTTPGPARAVAVVTGAVGVIGPLLLFVPAVFIALFGALVAGVLDLLGRKGERWVVDKHARRSARLSAPTIHTPRR